jgi:hypothetical protein
MISTHEINVIVDQIHLRTGTPSAATPPTQSVPVVRAVPQMMLLLPWL